MEKWFKKNLGDAMLAVEQQDRIKEVLLNEFSEAISAQNLAAFVRHESDGRLHCELFIYLTSESDLMAEVIGAQPCAKPNFEGMSILVGSQYSWTKYFPEKIS